MTGVAQVGGYAAESIARQPMGSAGRLTNFTVVLEGDTGQGRGYSVSVRKNGAAVATVTCLSNGGNSVPAAFTWTGSVTFTAGDQIDVAATAVNNPSCSKGISWRMTFSQ